MVSIDTVVRVHLTESTKRCFSKLCSPNTSTRLQQAVFLENTVEVTTIWWGVNREGLVQLDFGGLYGSPHRQNEWEDFLLKQLWPFFCVKLFLFQNIMRLFFGAPSWTCKHCKFSAPPSSFYTSMWRHLHHLPFPRKCEYETATRQPRFTKFHILVLQFTHKKQEDKICQDVKEMKSRRIERRRSPLPFK